MGLLLRREDFFFSLSLKQECFSPKCNTKTKLNEKEKMKTLLQEEGKSGSPEAGGRNRHRHRQGRVGSGRVGNRQVSQE